MLADNIDRRQLHGRQDDEAELLAELERIKAERAEEAAKVAAERAAEEEKKVRSAACSAVPCTAGRPGYSLQGRRSYTPLACALLTRVS